MTGSEAIAKISKNPPTLVLLDYKLPDISGRQVVEKVAEQCCSVPFLIITGHGDERLAVEMMKLGARDYIVKDASFFERLPSKVIQVIDKLQIENKLHEAEGALLESESKYRSLFEYA